MSSIVSMLTRVLAIALIPMSIGVSANAEEIKPTEKCSRVADLPESLSAAKILIFGEIHGTKESPELVASVICAFLKKTPGRNILLALEMPVSEQLSLDLALKAASINKLSEMARGSDFWNSDRQDGRASAAMFDLIGDVVSMSGGSPVRIVAFAPYKREENYEKYMADIILGEMAAQASETVIVLTGNLHAKSTQGVPWDPLFMPMASYLAGKHVKTVRVDFKRGKAWNCQQTCGEHEIFEKLGEKAALGLNDYSEKEGGFDAVYLIEQASPSVPVKERGIGKWLGEVSGAGAPYAAAMGNLL